jgi:hypothetical protein
MKAYAAGRRRQEVQRLLHGPGSLVSGDPDSPRVLTARLRERTAQLELAAGAGRELRRQQAEIIRELRLQVKGLRERLARAESELSKTRAKRARRMGRSR